VVDTAAGGSGGGGAGLTKAGRAVIERYRAIEADAAAAARIEQGDTSRGGTLFPAAGGRTAPAAGSRTATAAWKPAAPGKSLAAAVPKGQPATVQVRPVRATSVAAASATRRRGI
jgi:hypothetical protein